MVCALKRYIELPLIALCSWYIPGMFSALGTLDIGVVFRLAYFLYCGSDMFLATIEAKVVPCIYEGAKCPCGIFSWETCGLRKRALSDCYNKLPIAKKMLSLTICSLALL